MTRASRGLAATLAGGLKFKGTFSLQVRSTGPVSLMIADCTNDGAMRGYAKFDAARVAALKNPGMAPEAAARDLLGDGQLALVPGARAGLPARLDLGALREVAAEAVDLLVVDGDGLVGAERAHLAAAAVAIEVVALS